MSVYTHDGRGGSHPCQAGCTCARHPGGKRPTMTCQACGVVFSVGRSLVGKRMFCSKECDIRDYPANPERQRIRSETTHTALQNLPQDVKLKRNQAISEAKTGTTYSEESKSLLAKCASRNFRGGKTGDEFAAVLVPVGFIREYRLYYGDYVVKTGFAGPRRRTFHLDFAHVEGKVNIELDGPGHKTTREEDAARDAIIRGLGWRVIRINHD